MMRLRRRGGVWHVDAWIGGKRVRGALGTQSRDVAEHLRRRLETAIAEGPRSCLWQEISGVLPPNTCRRFADIAGVKAVTLPTWEDLRQAFEAFMTFEVTQGQLRDSTATRYRTTISTFSAFLEERGISVLAEIARPLIEDFKVWRMGRILQKKWARGATSLALDAAILHRIFAFALENDLIAKNVVATKATAGAPPPRVTQPFLPNELSRLREHAGDNLLPFLLLRWTGLRGGDAVDLSWDEIHLDGKEIERLTEKRRKRIVIPLHPELLSALEAEKARRNPAPTEKVLTNPLTGGIRSQPRLYQRLLALGKRAGVVNARPHRYRDTVALDLLLKGATLLDIARFLGDQVRTIERHYLPFVQQHRDRLRGLLESEGGLEGDK